MYDTAASPGMFQPLPIPNAVWSDISMDFFDGLPPSFGKTVIFVVVDHLTKCCSFFGHESSLYCSQCFSSILGSYLKASWVSQFYCE